MGKDLYVRSIPSEAGEEDLRKLFSVCGKVNHIHMVKDAKTGEFAGCAYVTMASEAQAQDALVTLDGALLISRTIAVSAARPRQAKSRQGNGARHRGHPAKGGKGRPR